MQTTLRIDDGIYRRTKAAAAEKGVTITRFIEEALTRQLGNPPSKSSVAAEIEERNKLMESLLQRTAHFKMGKKPTREEMNER